MIGNFRAPSQDEAIASIILNPRSKNQDRRIRIEDCDFASPRKVVAFIPDELGRNADSSAAGDEQAG